MAMRFLHLWAWIRLSSSKARAKAWSGYKFEIEKEMDPANKMVVTSHSAGNNTNILTNLQVGNNNYKVLSGSTIGMICDQTFPATRTEIEHGGDQASGEVVTSLQGGNDNNVE